MRRYQSRKAQRLHGAKHVRPLAFERKGKQTLRERFFGHAVGGPAGGARAALFDDWLKGDARRWEQIESGGWLRALYLPKSPIRAMRGAVLPAADACCVEIAVPYGRWEVLNQTAGRLKSGRHTQSRVTDRLSHKRTQPERCISIVRPQSPPGSYHRASAERAHGRSKFRPFPGCGT